MTENDAMEEDDDDLGVALDEDGNPMPKGEIALNQEKRETIRVAQREREKGLDRRRTKKGKRAKKGVKTKAWIVRKKEQMKLKGRTVAGDSKFTGRKRKPKF